MTNCIFSGHCMSYTCDNSCPTLVQTSYLLELNHIPMNSKVFKTDPNEVNQTLKMLESAQGCMKTVIDKDDTSFRSDLITYCAICENWKGSQLHSVVYHLKLSQYIEEVQNSWSSKRESDDLEMKKIWIKKAKILVISSIDFVNFKTFQCQMLLEMLQSRNSNPDNTTIIVSPPLSSLVGDGPFFGRLQDMMSKAVK